MLQQLKFPLFALLSIFSYARQSRAQGIPVIACTTFAHDGALATATIRDDSKVEIKITESGAGVVTTRLDIPFSKSCEQAFSNDGFWLASVVRSDSLKIIVVDRKSGLIHHQFSSPWSQNQPPFPTESGYRNTILAGFLPDQSLAIWRYLPRGAADPRGTDLHLQLWSVEGELISDQAVGSASDGPYAPIINSSLTQFWIPGNCATCYQGFSLADGKIVPSDALKVLREGDRGFAALPEQDVFLTVTASGERAGKVTSFDHTGAVKIQIDLPVPLNYWVPLVPKWLYAGIPRLSSDGQIAAVTRNEIAWVLIDTDRDWGSEIDILDTNPLRLITTYNTGPGGIQAMAIDHRDSTIRLVAFWNEHWHDLRWDEKHPGSWKKVTI